MKKEARVSLAHPILFVMDFENADVEIPEYPSDTIASFTPSCVSVRTLVDADGDALVTMTTNWEESPWEGFTRVFEGEILTPSRTIAVVTSENTKLIESPAAGTSTRLMVGVNRTDFPDVILVVLQ